MYAYKLTRIVFNDNSTIQPGNLTVIIGPNNAGKSRALKDIITKTTANPLIRGVIIKDIEWSLPQSLQELRDAYDVERNLEQHGSWIFRGLGPELAQEFRTAAGEWPTSFEEYFLQSEREPQTFAQNFGQAMVAFLTTEHRLQIVKESPSPSEQDQAANLLQALYWTGRSVEKLIRDLVKREFGREIALDNTLPQRLKFRIGDDFSEFPLEPRDAAPLMSKLELLDDQGDGIRSFVGMVVALLAIKRSLFLIDEPEAFLHPPQAFRIGQFIAEQAGDRRQIILSTHSTDVLRGILNTKKDVTILRIDRVDNKNNFRTLDPNRLKELVNDPLLSSARVLDGLFYSGAVVVEADSDARFYHTTSNKLRTGIDLHFVNADNKQTVSKIMKMYHDMGVRCAGIVDFDVLNKYTEFKAQLENLECNEKDTSAVLAIQGAIAQAAKEIPPDKRLKDAHQQITKLLNSINDTLNSSFASDEEAISAKEQVLHQIEKRSQDVAESAKSWKQFKKHGQSALPVEIREQFDILWQICAKKGLFINPCGELEAMLTEYGIQYNTDKRAWITQALTLLPNLESNTEKYPWKLIKEVHNYLLGGDEKGDSSALLP